MGHSTPKATPTPMKNVSAVTQIGSNPQSIYIYIYTTYMRARHRTNESGATYLDSSRSCRMCVEKLHRQGEWPFLKQLCERFNVQRVDKLKYLPTKPQKRFPYQAARARNRRRQQVSAQEANVQRSHPKKVSAASKQSKTSKRGRAVRYTPPLITVFK